MNKIKIITIGKLKNKSLIEEIQNLKKRISKLEILELKEIKQINENILKKKEYELLKPHINGQEQNTFLLCEYGKEYTTFEFDKIIKQTNEQTNNQTLQFIICGAFGPDENLKKQLPKKLSLSKMIFTHEQALYMLVEQIYRHYCFDKNIPYTK
jgi:23S rRNA (pseudouridine1915-N3)-methyltransferase